MTAHSKLKQPNRNNKLLQSGRRGDRIINVYNECIVLSDASGDVKISTRRMQVGLRQAIIIEIMQFLKIFKHTEKSK